MKQRIIYTMDDVGYGGGAHVATLNQVRFMQEGLGYEVAILSLAEAPAALCAQYPFVRFITPAALYGEAPRPGSDEAIMADLLSCVTADDMVCVPFENSRFREPVSRLCCRWKVQWIHIDYAHWCQLNTWTRQLTARDGALYAQFDRVVFISQMSRDGFVRLYPHLREKCRVCYNLMDTGQIGRLAANAPEKELFTGQNCLRLVTVARMEDQQKAIGRCLIAAEGLRHAGHHFEWVFVGGGTPEDMRLYRNFVNSAGLADSIFFAGPRQNPYPYIREADVFCLFSHYEGIPNTIFESMILGTPVMATRVGATAEQIAPGTGWLVENTSEAIGRGLRYLANTPNSIADARQNLAGYRYDIEEIKKTVAHIFSPNNDEEATKLEPMISVILPVYNVQEYLDECLASLESQTLQNIEVLMVNDGSTDNSGEVIDRYVARNPGKFIRLDKENEGPGKARNYGLQFAKSEYISFIDGDDFAAPDMMEQLYTVMQKHNCDIVQADLHGFNNNVDYQAIERAPFEKEGLVSKKELMLHSTRPVVASPCTKLYRKNLFDKFQFPGTWYEDLCLLPILYSHTDSVYYLPKPLYHYRWERAGSIQTQKDSPRTLEILKSQQRIMELCAPAWQKEADFAVYEHTCRFYKGTPRFAAETLAFAQKHAARFGQNPYVREKIDTGALPNLLPDNAALPKVIHYCRFEDKPLSAAAQLCIASWRQYLPGYSLREWSEKDIDPGENSYIQKAYLHRDWPALAGYIACKALHQEGGLYLDAGLRLKAPAESLVGYSAVLPRAGEKLVSWECMGAAPGHPLMRDILALYESTAYQAEDFDAIRQGIWQVLCEEYGLLEDGGTQILPGHIALYPAEKLLIDTGTGQSVAEHVCNGFSPVDDGRDEVRHQLQKRYYLERYAPEKEPIDNEEDPLCGTPYQIADTVVHRYGVFFMLRAIGKRLLAVILPKRLYQALEGAAVGKKRTD